METTCDAFLGGRVQAYQPTQGYRAATDPVFLAAACPAKDGHSVLELGCGVGVAALCLLARVAVHVTGLEVQPAYAELARRNAVLNSVSLKVITGDIGWIPAELKSQNFDHVILNPPYYTKGGGTAAQDRGREIANRECLDLTVWIDVAVRRLHPKGWLTVIVLTEQLPLLLTAMGAKFGAVEIMPLAARHGRDAARIILRARKGARAPLRLRAPFVIHEGAEHGQDGADFTADAEDILRNGRGFPPPA